MTFHNSKSIIIVAEEVLAEDRTLDSRTSVLATMTGTKGQEEDKEAAGLLTDETTVEEEGEEEGGQRGEPPGLENCSQNAGTGSRVSKLSLEDSLVRPSSGVS